MTRWLRGIGSPSSRLKQARAEAVRAALAAADDADALATATKHVENLDKLAGHAGFTRRRDLLHGALIIGVVSTLVAIGVGTRIGSTSAALSATASEATVEVSALLQRSPGTFHNASVIAGPGVVDPAARRMLAASAPEVTLTGLRQTSPNLRLRLRGGEGCLEIEAIDGGLTGTIGAAGADGTATSTEFVLRGHASVARHPADAQTAAREQSSVMSVCGDQTEALSIALAATGLVIERRISHDAQRSSVLPSMQAGEIDVGGTRSSLTPLDTVALRVTGHPAGSSGLSALLEAGKGGLALRFSGNVGSIETGTVDRRRDRMPTLLSVLNKESPVGTIYSTGAAVFAFLWGLRKVLDA